MAMHGWRRLLNDARRLERALEKAQQPETFQGIGADELVEIAPGVWGRPTDRPEPRTPLERAFAGVDDFLEGIDKVRRTAQGRHAYGSAARRRR